MVSAMKTQVMMAPIRATGQAIQYLRTCGQHHEQRDWACAALLAQAAQLQQTAACRRPQASTRGERGGGTHLPLVLA